MFPSCKSLFDPFSSLVLQGSYGVVKLAYNEDDDKHYVSRCGSPMSEQISWILCGSLESFTFSHSNRRLLLLIFFFFCLPFPSFKFYFLRLHNFPCVEPKIKAMTVTGPIWSASFLFLFKSLLLVSTPAALRSVDKKINPKKPCLWSGSLVQGQFSAFPSR